MKIDYNKQYPYIITKVQYHEVSVGKGKRGGPVLFQMLEIKCNECSNILHLRLGQLLKKPKTYIPRCKSCKNICNIDTINRCKMYAAKQKGKTYEELYGDITANKIREKISIFSKTMDKTNFLAAQKIYNDGRKGKKHKTYEEMWGKKAADHRKFLQSQKWLGDKNPMFGKPSPKKSGAGICGWYKNWYFRSLMELSFMINYIEKNNVEWQNAENREYMVQYTHYTGRDRNYFADFILNGNLMAEVKPRKLSTTPLVTLKKEAAIKFCQERGMEYKIFTERDFVKLTQEELKVLIEENKIKLLKDKHKQFIMGNI